MPFNAADVVPADDLDYDFTAYEEGVKGTTPEPTREAVDAYFAAMRENAQALGIDLGDLATSAAGEDSLATRAELVRTLAKVPQDKREELTKKQIDAVAALCQNQPSAEQITKLPFRVQEAYFGWLSEKFGNPQRRNGDMSD